MRKYNSKKCSNEFDGRSISHDDAIFAFQLSLKSRFWLEGFLNCSLCCFASLIWAELWKCLSRILEMTWRYEFTHSLAGDRCQKCNKAASSNACIMDRWWCTVLSVLALMCFGIDKQSSYVIGVARGRHGRAFALPSFNFALPSKPSSYLNCT